MELIRATERDVDELLAFYQHVADNMEETGLQHWHWGRYPNEKMIREDIPLGDLYYMLEGDNIAAAVVLMTGQEMAEAARSAIKGAVNSSLPASMLQLHAAATFLLDEEAASLLG